MSPTMEAPSIAVTILPSTRDCNKADEVETHTTPVPVKDLTVPDLASSMREIRMHEEPEPEPKALSPGKKTSPGQTMFIFDWDDTLLCTTFLQMIGSNNTVHPSAQGRLREVEQSAKQLLEKAASMGRLVIVTNSAEGWVEQSAAKYCPELMPLLQQVCIISSRTRYQKKFPGRANKWKVEAFLDVMRQPSSSDVTNIISIGDSHFEWEAAKALEEASNACIKTIKFRHMPSPVELSREMRSLSQHLETIVQRAQGLSVSLEQKWSGNAQAF
mmetsp:Transcript_55036/g.141685  ORF Transcript_55036/g.141685 Transcript_55036/m.141685 type:complete len:272 (+) Transcript_55036:122-937(+)